MARRNTRLDWVLAAATGAVFIVVSLLTNPEKGLVAAGCFCAFAIILATKFDFYRRSLGNPAFWIAFAALAVIHVIVIAKIDVPDMKSGMTAFPIIALDGAVVWALVSLVERMTREREK